jgi:large subunit ribosomal protein L25
METLVLEIETRDGSGKGSARRVRAKGKTPGILYGRGAASLSVAMDAHGFNKRIAHLEGTHLIELKSADAKLNGKKVLVKEIQFDPVGGSALHADFYEVALDRAIEVRVPLHFEGKAVGVTLGGILQPLIRELLVNCLPTHIPDFIAVDVSHLGMHDSIHVNDLKLPEGLTPVSDDNEAVVTVAPPAAEVKPVTEEAAPAEGEKAAAPAAEAGAGEAKKPEAAKKAEAKK